MFHGLYVYCQDHTPDHRSTAGPSDREDDTQRLSLKQENGFMLSTVSKAIIYQTSPEFYIKHQKLYVTSLSCVTETPTEVSMLTS